MLGDTGGCGLRSRGPAEHQDQELGPYAYGQVGDAIAVDVPHPCHGLANLACACWATLVRASWTMRKHAVSSSRGSRPLASTKPVLISTVMPVRWAYLSIYQRNAAARPRSSSIAGRRSRERSRTRLSASST